MLIYPIRTLTYIFAETLSRAVDRTLSPTQKLKHGFSTLKSQGIVPIFTSFAMISKALQPEIQKEDRFTGVENPKIPGIQHTYMS